MTSSSPTNTPLTDRFAKLAPSDLSEPERESLIALALQVLEPSAPYQTFCDAETVQRYCRLRFAAESRELFACAFLDTRHRLIDLSVLFQGTIDGCSVHPRVVVEAALRHRTAAVIFVHNHPSGDPTPSQADRRITETLRQALDLLDIRVLDHIVVAREGSVSLAARGLL